jgi:hypothetical protein
MPRGFEAANRRLGFVRGPRADIPRTQVHGRSDEPEGLIGQIGLNLRRLLISLNAQGGGALADDWIGRQICPRSTLVVSLRVW